MAEEYSEESDLTLFLIIASLSTWSISHERVPVWRKSILSIMLAIGVLLSTLVKLSFLGAAIPAMLSIYGFQILSLFRSPAKKAIFSLLVSLAAPSGLFFSILLSITVAKPFPDTIRRNTDDPAPTNAPRQQLLSTTSGNDLGPHPVSITEYSLHSVPNEATDSMEEIGTSRLFTFTSSLFNHRVVVLVGAEWRTLMREWLVGACNDITESIVYNMVNHFFTCGFFIGE